MEDRKIAVQFDSVTFAYGDVVVLQDVSFHIHRGEFTALVGPNGSGKTTVIKLILGLEQPSAGRITLFGDAQDAFTNARWRGRLGYVPQQAPADRDFPVTVRDVVRMGLLHSSRGYDRSSKAKVDAAMEQAGITDLARRSWRALSGGQRRRVLVARALSTQPEILVLDEPTANMDGESESRLFETLGRLKGGGGQASGATILIVTHDMNFVSALTDRALCLGDEAHRHKIVQHRTELAEAQGNSLRVLHGEDIPAGDCCKYE